MAETYCLQNCCILISYDLLEECLLVGFGSLFCYCLIREGRAYFQLGGLVPGGKFVGGSGAILPQKILKSKCHPHKKWGGGGGAGMSRGNVWGWVGGWVRCNYFKPNCVQG